MRIYFKFRLHIYIAYTNLMSTIYRDCDNHINFFVKTWPRPSQTSVIKLGNCTGHTESRGAIGFLTKKHCLV